MRIEEACVEKGDQQDAVRSLGRDERRASQGGRGDILSGKSIDGAARDQIHGDGEALENDQCRYVVSGRVFHFSRDGEEALPAAECVENAQNRAEGVAERRVSDKVHVLLPDIGRRLWLAVHQGPNDEEDWNDDAQSCRCCGQCSVSAMDHVGR